MLIDSGYLGGLDDTFVPCSEELLITSCGHYKLITLNKFITYRKNGRTDYQLIYIASGVARFTIHNVPMTLHEGQMVLIRPNTSQNYQYLKEDSPELYWVHFTGTAVESLLGNLSFNGYDIMDAGIHTHYISLFIKMVRELQLKDSCFQELCCTYFTQLIYLIKRNHYTNTTFIGNNIHIIRKIEETIQERYYENKEISQYAKDFNVSVSWLIRTFRQKNGTTPQAYIKQLRIDKSKDYLVNTDFSIAEVADTVGYHNPLYFSRLFTRQVGMTPRDYRKIHIKK